MLDAAVFDLDGTLWDTTEVVARAWNAAMFELSWPFPALSAGDIASVMGLTHEEIFPRLFPGVERERWEPFSARCYHYEEEYLRQSGGILYPGLRPGLQRLHEALPLAIVSNCQKGYIEVFQQTTGLGGYFVDWECHGRTGASKGENLVALMRRQGWSRAVLVGDAGTDEEAAHKAGCRFLHVTYGFGSCPQAHWRAQDFAEVVTCILEARGH